MGSVFIRGATIWDATGAPAVMGDVLVTDRHIEWVRPGGAGESVQAERVIDAAGRFLMPGMVEGHAHISFGNAAGTEELVQPSPEAHTLITMQGARDLIDAGFTSAYGASEAKLRLGVAIRDAVNAGLIPGPRIRAGSMEITVVGSIGDESREHNPRIGISHIISGPEEMRHAVRLACREGCDNIKLDISGDPFYPTAPAHTTPMAWDEVKMAVDTAHAYGKKVNAHARSAESVKHAIRAGVTAIFHAEFHDEEMLDLCEEAKDRIFIAPSIGLFHTMIHEGEPWLPKGTAEAMGIPQLVEASIETHSALRKRGIRHVIGGDYGLAWNRQGTNARDVRHLVDYYGYTPAEALICATRHGGLLMRDEGDLGTIEPGKLADLLLIDGDPLTDVDAVADRSRIAMVMKDGALHSLAAGL
ncbi:amidohydrolase family protein [Sphingomonas sp. 35-24ZXX]|uniref:amidohydrolase family protein n=1 Tax=Sphingomonas sp. 35-24ZXX TaxID=1545915 RepID=UPI00068930D3|nr:amidohydrolase family protein [Sphingomonas sp. 35-24ZXX]